MIPIVFDQKGSQFCLTKNDYKGGVLPDSTCVTPHKGRFGSVMESALELTPGHVLSDFSERVLKKANPKVYPYAIHSVVFASGWRVAVWALCSTSGDVY